MMRMDEVHILIIDDEKIIRDGTEHVLKKEGYKVVTAKDGEEGLECMKSAAFHMLILDLMMPGIRGMDVLKLVQKQCPDLLVIVITGYATVGNAVDAMKIGAYDFIPKPFKPDQLRIVIDRASERIRLTAEAVRLEKERQRTLQDLDREKSRTQTILQSLPDGVVVSTTDGRVALMNPVFARMADREPGEKPGRPIEDYLAEEGFCSQVRRTSRGEFPAGQTSLTHDFSPGTGRYLRAHSTPVMSDTGECLGAVTLLMDITELKLLDRLKSEFVTHVSHELRSPLSTIHQQLVMVLTELVGDGPSERRDMLTRAKEKTQGLISLIGDLLDLSRIEAGAVLADRKPVDVGRVVEGVVRFLESRAREKNQTLACRLPEGEPARVQADPQAVEMVVGNLILNAINYTPESGRIEVRVAVEGSEVSLAVQDTGFGIEPRHLEKIFEKFYRVKDDNTRFITGTGLGLPIVKGIVEGLRGKVTVASEPGVGSTFTVRLPAACA